MAPLAARRLAEQVGLGQRILAIGLLCATQALDLRRPAGARDATTARSRAGARRVAVRRPGAPYPADLEPLVELVRSGALADALGAHP